MAASQELAASISAILHYGKEKPSSKFICTLAQAAHGVKLLKINPRVGEQSIQEARLHLAGVCQNIEGYFSGALANRLFWIP